MSYLPLWGHAKAGVYALEPPLPPSPQGRPLSVPFSSLPSMTQALSLPPRTVTSSFAFEKGSQEVALAGQAFTA